MNGPAAVGERRKWDRQDLGRRLCHALKIAERAVQRLAASGYTDPEEPGNNLQPEKVITETALLLYAASSASQVDGVQERIQHIAHLLIPHARSDRILLSVCLKPSLALDYAEAHILLSRLGYQDLRFDKVVRQTIRSQAFTGRERTPHRILEQDWLRTSCGHSKTSVRRHMISVARKSALGRPMDVFGGTREDVYAFTHALMYVTGVGFSPRRLPRAKVTILAEAEAGLARCLDEPDYDLGGEVLLAWPLTKSKWSAAAAFGFRVLARAEDKAGFLPAPGMRLARLEKLQGDARTDFLLATAYHTIYVMGLLCAAALRPNFAPPETIPTKSNLRGSSKVILSFLESDGPNVHWRDEIDQLEDLERDAIAGLLLTIGLRRKIALRDFGAVFELLKKGYDLGLADGPSSSQATEMLERLSAFSESSPNQNAKANEGQSPIIALKLASDPHTH